MIPMRDDQHTKLGAIGPRDEDQAVAPQYASTRLFGLLAQLEEFEAEAEVLIREIGPADAVAKERLSRQFNACLAKVRPCFEEIGRMLGDRGVWRESIVKLHERFEKAKQVTA
jgi:hypothetical protein